MIILITSIGPGLGSAVEVCCTGSVVDGTGVPGFGTVPGVGSSVLIDGDTVGS